MSQSTTSTMLRQINAIVNENVDNGDDTSVLTTPTVVTDGVNELEDVLHSSVNGDARIGSCIVTIFPPFFDKNLLLPELWFPDAQSKLQQWCGQYELGSEDGKLHAHIFMKFEHKGRPRFDELRKLIPKVTHCTGNIQVTKSRTKVSIQCAINYCMKEDTRHPDCSPFIWKDTCAFDQAVWDKRGKKVPKKSETEKIVDYINTKPTHWKWDQIVHENLESQYMLASCSWGKRHHEGRVATDERRVIKDVIIMYGAGGTGKTTLAQSWDKKEDEPDGVRYYKRNTDDGDFWGGGRTAYNGQRQIHYEEFTGNEKFGNFKQVTDLKKHGQPVNVKNGGRDLNHDTVLITSNTHPVGWYHSKCSKDHKQFHPFWRRVTQVWFFPATRPDGSWNRPDDENPPYYIDQTDEWLAFDGDFESAVAHAESHWPLPEEILAPTTEGPVAAGFTLPESRKRDGDEFAEYCRTGKYPRTS
ncbi:MAG: replication associated protein [Avonheates virus Gas_1078]|uniref:replication associated protein n=1 Tax=Avonheates virus Gas_1078 TaxID=2914477 RepID=UPI002481F319|nr:MAG: replication associated protein [Avonheates virus Gas_1078]UNI72593.1 MAG: replication associated protein [Avonheates virus Gas_1078]